MIIQGELGTTDTIIKSVSPAQGSLGSVATMRFRNPAAYVLTVSRYSKKNNRTDVLYQYTLSAGDTVLDMNLYLLEAGDILYAKSSIAGTTYVITIN
jgi:hypothetical protein